MNNFRLENKKITRIDYNVYDTDEIEDEIIKEDLKVEVQGKIGQSKVDLHKKAIFFEVSIEGNIENTNLLTRDLIIEAQFNFYSDITNSNDNEELFHASLIELNKVIIGITSLDNKNPLSIQDNINEMIKGE